MSFTTYCSIIKKVSTICRLTNEKAGTAMNLSDLKRNAYMLRDTHAKQGYVRWWHSFTGTCPETNVSRTFFVEYFVMNPGLGGDKPILGQHPYYKKQGMKPSYIMIKAGAFPDENGEDGKQLHAFYPINALKAASDPLYVQVDDCFFSEYRIAGSVDVTPYEARHRSLMTDSGSMEWDLEMYKAISCHTGPIAGRFFTALNALESFWHGEGIRTHFRGSVTLDGVRYEVSTENSYGYADKHWGKSYNNPWLQFASSHLISERTGKELKHSALAIDGSCPRFLWFPLKRKLMLQLTYTGEDFEYNFARPDLFSRCKWKVKETNKRYIWQIMAQNKTSVIKLTCSSQKAHMMPVNYEAPDGSLSRNTLWGGGMGTGTIEIYRRIPGGVQLIDKLTVSDGFCEYRKYENGTP